MKGINISRTFGSPVSNQAPLNASQTFWELTCWIDPFTPVTDPRGRPPDFNFLLFHPVFEESWWNRTIRFNPSRLGLATPRRMANPGSPTEYVKTTSNSSLPLLTHIVSKFLLVLFLAILVLFLNRALLYDDSTSTTIYHTFNMFCYFTPLLGAMIADGWLGKYKYECCVKLEMTLPILTRLIAGNLKITSGNRACFYSTRKSSRGGQEIRGVVLLGRPWSCPRSCQGEGVP